MRQLDHWHPESSEAFGRKMYCSHWCRGERGGKGADGLPGGEGMVRGVEQGGGLGRGRGGETVSVHRARLWRARC